jgi:hypothetical protein
MIIGAAMLMRVETSFRIMGYPGLAMLVLPRAACGASGWRSDHRAIDAHATADVRLTAGCSRRAL